MRTTPYNNLSSQKYNLTFDGFECCVFSRLFMRSFTPYPIASYGNCLCCLFVLIIIYYLLSI